MIATFLIIHGLSALALSGALTRSAISVRRRRILVSIY
jgi:hypothetical protein